MITWSSFIFHNPASILIEIIAVIHDYVMIFLSRVMIIIFLVILFSFNSCYVDLSFFEEHQLEIVWTIVPFLILLFIVVPSLRSLYMLDTCIFCGMSVSIYGHQWYWSYFYKDLCQDSFDSYMISNNESNLRLVETDNCLVIPRFIPIRFLLGSADVIHSWTLPSFGVKIDAIPGRINQFCFSSKRSGIFFGQCSEICGANHRFIPIVIESIKFSDFIRII